MWLIAWGSWGENKQNKKNHAISELNRFKRNILQNGFRKQNKIASKYLPSYVN